MIGRWLGVGAFLAAVLVGATCDESPTSVAAFVGGHWVFTVDRAWNRASGRFTLESYEFTEADYEPTSSGQSYAVVLTSGGDTAFIGATPIVAVRRTASVDRVVFELIRGVFAGGRFIVWPRGAALQGELTVYGSGVPIGSSDRGALVPEP